MKIAIVGSGYVGLVTGACLAESGNNVVCIDHNDEKIAGLRSGIVPFHEPLLDAVVLRESRLGNLKFTTNLAEGVHLADIIFLALGTPTGIDGYPDIDPLLQCVDDLSITLQHDCLVVVKSTVPPGTCEAIQTRFDARPAHPSGRCAITVASNPEFLAEGSAVTDFRMPARIVLGASNEIDARILKDLYMPFDPDGTRLIEMDLRSAEFSKYACNAMLAARISMINELANIAERMDADIGSACQVLKSDPRIGPRYLEPGAGYGGSCLPKDLRALIRMASDKGEPASMLHSIEQVNRRQVTLIYHAIEKYFWGCFQGRCVAVWGLAFKAGTDDIREAPSLTLIQALLEAGAQVRAYDPIAEPAVKTSLVHSELVLAGSAEQACVNADVLVVMTEWEEFMTPDFKWLASTLRSPAIFDTRDLYRGKDLNAMGLRHYRPGRIFATRPGGKPLLTGAPLLTAEVLKPPKSISRKPPISAY